MFDLTDEQAQEILSLIKGSEQLPMSVVRQWIQENELDLQPGAVLRALRQRRTAETMATLSSVRLNNMMRRFLDADDIMPEFCEQMIASHQDAIVMLEAKKAELE